MKDKARSLLNQAVESGRIKREPCEVCGVAKSEAHHTDYTKPLEVRWLCRRHHSKVEAALRSSDFESTLSSGVSGSGEGKSDSRARGLLCPVCGPMPYTSKRRLSEHIRLIHPEVAEAVA